MKHQTRSIIPVVVPTYLYNNTMKRVCVVAHAAQTYILFQRYTAAISRISGVRGHNMYTGIYRAGCVSCSSTLLHVHT